MPSLDDKADAVTRQMKELRALPEELNRARLLDPAECNPRSVCDVVVAADAADAAGR